MRAYLVDGNPNPSVSTTTDWIWVTKKSVPKYLPPEDYEAIQDILDD
jgi:hypothetical protein